MMQASIKQETTGTAVCDGGGDAGGGECRGDGGWEEGPAGTHRWVGYSDLVTMAL